MKKKSFAVVLTPIEFTGAQPFEIIPEHLLTRPDDEKLDLIRPHLDSFGRWASYLYETHWTDNQGKRVERGDWNYWVVQYDGPNDRVHDLDVAFALCEPSIELGDNFVWFEQGENSGYALIHFPGASYSFFQARMAAGYSRSTITSDALLECREIYDLLKVVRVSHPTIVQIAERFHRLRILPRNDMFYSLAHFTILEALLTHEPKTDFDSLTHQISFKMKLLANRFRHPLDDTFYTPVNPSKKPRVVELWQLLYGFRSKIAHGDVPDFAGKFKPLGSSDLVAAFLVEAAKRVLLMSLTEPEFMRDLNAC